MQLNSFEFYDFWLLFSIGFNNKGTKVSGILSSSDLLNHSVLSVDELNYGMSKLIENGYAIKENDRFILTPKALEFYKLHEIKNEGCIVTTQRMSRLFMKENAKMDCKLTEYFEVDKKGRISTK